MSDDDWRQTVAEFATSGACLDTALLVAAELLLLVSGMVLERKKTIHRLRRRWPGEATLYWHTWIFESLPTVPPLPFFRKCASREGMEALLACLGIPPAAPGVAGLKETIDRYLEMEISSAGRRRPKADYIGSFCLAEWHGLS